jgi:hypothetical protein
MKRLLFALFAVIALLGTTMTSASAGGAETTDVFDQDHLSVYAPNGARLVRQANGLSVAVAMTTPQPGGYTYPEGIAQGHPEVFTLWMFVFNHPENCTNPCGADDTTNSDVEFGVYNAAGHASDGGTLTLAGRVGIGDTARAPQGVTPHPLSNPDGAEVHLAVTSHGGLDPATLPGEFRNPTGSPTCGCWWVAIFD